MEFYEQWKIFREVSLPPMHGEEEGEIWTARLVLNSGESPELVGAVGHKRARESVDPCVAIDQEQSGGRF